MKIKKIMKILIICLLFTTSLIGKQPEETSPLLFVSLGGNCEVAMQLRNHNLRSQAFPFDWMLTSNHDTFLKILEDDFQFFLNEQYIFQNPETPSILENAYYECEFRHDPITNLQRDLQIHLEELKEKYERRIDRFRKLKEYSGKVFFIRAAYNKEGGKHYWWSPSHNYITNEQAKKLKTALQRFFPSLDFTLVIVNYAEESLGKIDAEGVLSFQVRGQSTTLDYAKIFHKLLKQK